MSSDKKRDRSSSDVRSRPAIDARSRPAIARGVIPRAPVPQFARIVEQDDGDSDAVTLARDDFDAVTLARGDFDAVTLARNDFDAVTLARHRSVPDSKSPFDLPRAQAVIEPEAAPSEDRRTAERTSESSFAVSSSRAPRASARTYVDSIQPVRVPVAQSESLPTPPPFWTRTWATAALLFVIAGVTVGIVASLRARSLDPEKERRRAAAWSGVQGTERQAEAPLPRAIPAAGLTPPAPLAPQPVALLPNPSATPPNPQAPTALPPPPPPAMTIPVRSVMSLPQASAMAKSSNGARTTDVGVGHGAAVKGGAAQRTTNSTSPVIVSPSGHHMTTGTSAVRSSPPAPVAKNPPSSSSSPPDEPRASDEPNPPPKSSPTPPPTPAPPGTSEAWITEERRF